MRVAPSPLAGQGSIPVAFQNPAWLLTLASCIALAGGCQPDARIEISRPSQPVRKLATARATYTQGPGELVTIRLEVLSRPGPRQVRRDYLVITCEATDAHTASRIGDLTTDGQKVTATYFFGSGSEISRVSAVSGQVTCRRANSIADDLSPQVIIKGDFDLLCTNDTRLKGTFTAVPAAVG